MPETQQIVSDFIQGYALEHGSLAMCFALRHPSHGGPTWEEYADQISKAENAYPT